MLDSVEVTCPFCFESISVGIDASGGSPQKFTYDCEVCCKPILIRISTDTEGNFTHSAEREYD